MKGCVRVHCLREEKESQSDPSMAEEDIHAEPPLSPGSQVGEYVVESKLGAGAFGSVFVAVHPVIGKRVAVKVLSRKYADDEQIVSRFVAEARAVNAIGHENIVDIFSFGRLADGRHFFVMELLDGPTLAQHLEKKGRLTVRETIELLEPIARALDAAHKAGIAHRDLKPSNIVLTKRSDETWRPKLLDFGIAKLMHETVPKEHRTDTGLVVGTPHYMSPEQCRGANVDHRTDVYSFGVMTFQLLTGMLPFNGDSTIEIMMKHVGELPPDLGLLRPDLPQAIAVLLRSMLDKSADRRPATLMDSIRALRAAADGFADREPPPLAARAMAEAAPATWTAERASLQQAGAKGRSPAP